MLISANSLQWTLRKEAWERKLVTTGNNEPLDIDADADHDEIYGDYGYAEPQAVDQVIELPVEAPVDLGDGEEVIDKLLQAFGVA